MSGYNAGMSHNESISSGAPETNISSICKGYKEKKKNKAGKNSDTSWKLRYLTKKNYHS